MNRRWLVVLLCSVMAVAIPIDAVAQGIGGRVRRKVAEVAGKDAKQEASQPVASTVYSGDVLELTEPVMKGFVNGVRVELALLKEFADLMDTYKRPEDYNRCRQETAMSPEGMEIFNLMSTLGDSVTAEQIQRMTVKMNEQFLALTKNTCGPDASEDWPHTKRKERVDTIVAKAAAAAGPVKPAEPPPEPSGGPAMEPAFDPPMVQDLGMTLRQYAITWERAENYCMLLQAGAIHPLQPVVHPADGGKIFWVYSEPEARAIEPLCPEILKVRDQMNVLKVHIYWDDSGR